MTSKVYTAKEVASHNRENDLWIVMNRKVYDVSLFAKDHPGGEEVLLDVAGKDATACFDDIGHSVSAILAREKYNIGELGSTEIIETRKHVTIEGTSTEGSFLNDSIMTENEDWNYQNIKKDSISPSMVALVGMLGIMIYFFVSYFI